MMGLGSGVVVAHLITLAISPLITRMYTPDQFGMFALFTSLVSILTLLSTGAYEFSIVLPKKEKTAIQLFKVSILCSVLFSIVFYILLLFTAPFISDSTTLSISFLFLLPLGIFFHSLMSSFNYWFNRNEYFNEFAQAKIAMSVGTGLFQLGFGAGGFTSVGLLIGLIAGRFFSAGTMALKKAGELRELFTGWAKQDLKEAAAAYSDHPKFVLLSSLLSSVAIEVPVLLITSLFGSRELGFYGLGFRILMAPVTLVSLSVGHVYFQKFAARKNKRETLAPYILRLWAILSLIGILPFTGLFFVSEPVFIFAFGAEWAGAGKVASILSPMLFFLFITNPTSKSLLVLNKQKIMPFISAGSLSIRLAALLTGYYLYDFYIALGLMVAGQIIVYIIQALYVYRSARKWDSQISTNSDF